MSKRFKYALDGLLKKHEQEMDALKPELQQINQVIGQRERELASQNARALEAEREILELSRESARIDLGHRLNAQLFQRQALEEARGTQAEIDRVGRLRDQVLSQLMERRQAARAVEKHRDRMAKAHESEAAKKADLELEELWLARNARSRT